jgi:hypothetical protein
MTTELMLSKMRKVKAMFNVLMSAFKEKLKKRRAFYIISFHLFPTFDRLQL